MEVLHFCQEAYGSGIVFFSVQHIKWYMITICHITGDVDFDHLVNKVYVRFLHNKVTLFLPCN